jgi:ligand-binding sensor domain-containing protein
MINYKMRVIILLSILHLGAFQLIHSQWIQYHIGNTHGIQGTLVSSGLEDKNGNLWFGTDQGVTNYHPNLGIWNTYDVSDGLQNSFVYQVFEDQEGGIWVTTNGGGVSFYANSNWFTFTMKDGLPYDIARAVTQTPDGTLWFGTYGKGICSYRKETGFRKFTGKGIDNCYVLSMLAVSDTVLLIGTLDEGLIRLHNNQVSLIQAENGLEGDRIFAVYKDQSGTIWIGTNEGVQQFNPVTNRMLPCPGTMQGKEVHSICENGAGDIIFAGAERIYRFSKGSWSSWIPDNLNPPTSFYSAFFDHDDNEWFGLRQD